MPKNHRKIPQYINSRLASIAGRHIQAGVLLEVAKTELATGGHLEHLSIACNNGVCTAPSPFIPDPSTGKFSYRNVNGYVYKRRDLPKEDYEVSFDAPNYGDWSRGSHTVTFYRQRYVRQFIAPSGSTLVVSLRDTADPSRVQIRVVVSDVLDREDPQFEIRLLNAVNLLMESVGQCDVAIAGSSFAEYVATLRVSWEILPPGTAEEAIRRVFRGRTPTESERLAITDRFVFFQTLRPIAIIVGQSEFMRYFGAKLREDLVLFENVVYGNAIYIMYGDWQSTSQLTRIELLSGRFGAEFERVVHTANWKEKVLRILRQRGYRPHP